MLRLTSWPQAEQNFIGEKSESVVEVYHRGLRARQPGAERAAACRVTVFLVLIVDGAGRPPPVARLLLARSKRSGLAILATASSYRF